MIIPLSNALKNNTFSHEIIIMPKTLHNLLYLSPQSHEFLRCKQMLLQVSEFTNQALVHITQMVTTSGIIL